METIHIRIWQEEAEPDNAFAAMSCHCHGYDVYGDLLAHASWTEYFFFCGHLGCDLPPSDCEHKKCAPVLSVSHKSLRYKSQPAKTVISVSARPV